MSKEDVELKLETLYGFDQEVEALSKKKQALIDSILTPELKDQIQEIEEEFAQQAAGANENISKLKEVIKQDILTLGETVKSEHYMVKWVKGREGGYDTAKLIGYAAAHPELNQFKKPDGEPTVSFTQVKDK